MSFFSRLFKWIFGTGARGLIPNPGPGAKAFLCGINAYRDSPLRGCVNDVKFIKDVLMSKFAFDEKGILVLLDEDATTANIVDGLRWLSAGATPGDPRLHHFSGHGTQYPNANEEDGMSEVIVPYDFDWSPSRMISDKSYLSIFSSMTPGTLFDWVSDSCHSGDLNRSLPLANSFCPRHDSFRFLKPPKKIMLQLASRMRRPTRIIRAAMASNVSVGFVSACRSNQAAADTRINGVPCGALTHYLYSRLAKAENQTLREVVMGVREDLAKNKYDQVPQVEGTRADKPFLKP